MGINFMSKMFGFEFVYYSDYEIDTKPIYNTYTFNFIGSDEELEELYNNSIEGHTYDTFQSKMESKYGLHDYVGSETVLFGYISDEIIPDNYNEVVNKWKEYFVENGFKVGETTINNSRLYID
jgi:hypothetical protein